MANQSRSSGIQKSISAYDLHLLVLGQKMGLSEIERVQSLIKNDPAFRDARLMLMGAEHAPPSLRTEQVCWFAEHEPRTFLGAHASGAARGNFDEAKHRWLVTAEVHRSEPDIVANAAWFMLYADPDRGAELLESRARQEDDAEWALQAAVYLAAARDVHKSRRASWAVRVVNAGFLVFRHDEEVDARRVQVLRIMRECARQAGMQAAARPLELAEAVKVRERSDGPSHTQLTEVLRGFVALAAGETPIAEQHLRRAGALETLPTDSLVSFAVELAALGAKEVVLVEVEAIERRFRACAEQAKRWGESVKRGEYGLHPCFPPKGDV